MAITPEQFEADLQRREAALTGQTQTMVGGQPAETTTVLPDPAQKTFLPPGAEAPTLQQGRTMGAQADIPPAALDPVEADLQRREAASRPASGDSALKRFDQAVLSTVPPGLRSTLSAMGRVGANFNDTLAKHLGATPDMVDEQLQKVGVRLFSQPNASANAIRGWMREAGIPVERTNDLEGQLGRGMFEGMIQSAAWYAALPRFLALQGIQAGSAIGEVVKKVGEWSLKNPGLFTAQNVTASQGATVAEEEIGGPLASLAGGAAGSMVPGIASAGVRAATYPIRAASRFIAGPEALPNPLLRPGTNTEAPRAFVAGERDAQQFRLAQEHEALIRGSGPADVGAASTRLSRTLDEAETAARAHMRSLYAPYADTPVDPAITVNRMARLHQAVTPSEQAGPNFPREQMNMIDQLYVRRIPAEPPGQPPAGVPFGQPLPPVSPGTPARIEIVPTTLDDLINLRSDLLRDAANARRGGADTPANPKRARYLNRLAQGVQENIDAATRGTPAEAGIQAANRFANQYYSMFERGIVGRTYTPTTGRREGATTDEGLAEKMLQTGRNRGQDAFAQLQRMDTPVPVGFGNYNTLQAAEQAVRAIFRQAAEAHPLGAEKWYAANRRTIGSMAQTAYDLEQTSRRLSQIHEIERNLGRDAISRFIGPDPQNAYARLFSAADPAADARRIMMSVGTDADALRGFRAGVTEQLLFATQGQGSALKGLFSQPKIDRMLREVLDPAEYRRLGRIAELGARMEAGEKTLGGRWTTSGLPILARIMGAQAGTTIAHMVGRGNIQTPAIVSGIMRNWVTDALGGIPPHELVTRAILDPRWERILMGKVPQTTAEAKTFTRTVRRLIATGSAISNQANPTPGDDE